MTAPDKALLAAAGWIEHPTADTWAHPTAPTDWRSVDLATRTQLRAQGWQRIDGVWRHPEKHGIAPSAEVACRLALADLGAETAAWARRVAADTTGTPKSIRRLAHAYLASADAAAVPSSCGECTHSRLAGRQFRASALSGKPLRCKHPVQRRTGEGEGMLVWERDPPPRSCPLVTASDGDAAAVSPPTPGTDPPGEPEPAGADSVAAREAVRRWLELPAETRAEIDAWLRQLADEDIAGETIGLAAAALRALPTLAAHLAQYEELQRERIRHPARRGSPLAVLDAATAWYRGPGADHAMDLRCAVAEYLGESDDDD
jgi:hypothetical protein